MHTLDLDVAWNDGSRGRREPAIQVHRASEDTVILRQSLALSYEAPFLYLLFGAERALLLDTGARADPARFPLRATVDTLIDEWLEAHPAVGYELVIAHSHSHGDHVAGDAQFFGRARTRIVGHDPRAVAEFFGVADWPSTSGRLDLGGRELVIMPIPGHQLASIAVYDENTGVLLSGDTVYPGRLYVSDMDAFVDSIDRLSEFADVHEVSAILGAHIEMTGTPGKDFAIGSRRHPDEASLPLSVSHLQAIQTGAHAVAGLPGAHQFAHFAIWNGSGGGARVWLIARGVMMRLRGR